MAVLSWIAALCLLPAAAAQAAQATVYSMSTDGPWATAAGSTWQAQSFTTGAVSSTLSSVSVRIRNANASNSSSVPSSLSVALHASSGGQPGTKVTDLLTGTSVGAWADTDFSASSTQALSPSTTYFIVVTGSSGGTIGWKYNTSTQPTTSVSPAPTFTNMTSTDGGSTWTTNSGSYANMTVQVDELPPAAPTLATLTPGNGTLAVTATLGSDNGSPVTDVEYSLDSGTWTSSGQTSGSFTISGLVNGTGVSVRVRAVSAIGSGAASNSLTGTPGLPGAPTGVGATAGVGSAQVSWVAPASNGGFAITGYRATASPGGGTCTSAGTGCTVTGLSNGTSYTFTVVAINVVGDSPASSPSASVTPQAAPAPPPAPPAPAPPAPAPTQSSPSDSPSPTASMAADPSPSTSGGSSVATPTPTATPTRSPRPTATRTRDPQPTDAPLASPSALSTTVTTETATPSSPVDAGEVRAEVGPSASEATTASATPDPTSTGGSAVNVPATGSQSGAGESPAQPQVNVLLDDAPAGPSMQMQVDLAVDEPVAGRPAVVQAAGLLPGSEVQAVVYSEPRVIGTATADADGRASITAVMPLDLEPGTHTVVATGTGPQGQPVQAVGAFTLGAAGLVTAFAPPNQVAAPITADDPELARALEAGKPLYDQSLYPAVTATLAMTVAAFIGLAGVGGMSAFGIGADEDAARTRNVEVVTKKLKALGAEETALGDQSRTWRLPGTSTTDRWVSTWPNVIGQVSALGSRILVDGSWARAIFGSAGLVVPWLLGLLLGLLASASVGFQALPPALPLFIAILGLGILDAAAGACAWLVIAAGALLTGHLTTWSEVRTLIGLFAIFASISLLAHVIRPLRRLPGTGPKATFDRIADYVMPPIFLAFATTSLCKALNGLSGLDLMSSEDYAEIRWSVIGFFIIRLAMEDVSIRLYPQRSAQVQPPKLTRQKVAPAWGSVLLRMAIFLVIAAPFFGLGWMTLLAAILLAVPNALKIYEDRLPNSVWLNKWYPRGVARFIILVVIGLYLVAWLLGMDSSDAGTRQAYTLILVPGIIGGIIELVGREGWDWPNTWAKRVAGIFVWAFAICVITGLLTLTSVQASALSN